MAEWKQCAICKDYGWFDSDFLKHRCQPMIVEVNANIAQFCKYMGVSNLNQIKALDYPAPSPAQRAP